MKSYEVGQITLSKDPVIESGCTAIVWASRRSKDGWPTGQGTTYDLLATRRE